MSKESIYDEQIAPLMLKAAEVAKQHGIDFVAVVDIADADDPYAIGVTRSVGSNPQPSVGLVNYAASHKGNVDSMMMQLVREQKDTPHNSIVITMLSRGF